MKITKSVIKRIIKEEYEKLTSEAYHNIRVSDIVRAARMPTTKSSSPASPTREDQFSPIYEKAKQRFNAEERFGPNNAVKEQSMRAWRVLSMTRPTALVLDNDALVQAITKYSDRDIDIQQLIAAIPSSVKI